MKEVPLNLIRRRLPSAALPDPQERARDQVAELLERSAVPAGARVAFTAGSRGIGGAAGVLRGAVRAAADRGCRPFLFSAMGSHGGGTAEGQRGVLASLGITEESVGAPVSCSDMTYPGDAAVLEAMGRMLRPEREADVRMAVVDSTLALDRMWVSDPVLAEAAETEEVEVVERSLHLRFDSGGRLLP